MADELDRAQAASEVYENAAMRSHSARRFSPSPHPSPARGEGVKCEDCDKPIPAARLKANPAATRCVSCQTKFECGGH